MARGWHYMKLSLSSALLLYFSGMCILLLFLSFCRFSFVFCCVFSYSRWSSLLSVVLSCDKGGLKKNQNAPRPSEHPPVDKMSKRLGRIIDCKYKKNSSWHLKGFPDCSNNGSTV